VLERIGALYDPRRVRALRQKLARFSELLDGVELCNRLLEPYRKRMKSDCQQLEQKIGYKRKSGPTVLKIFGPATLWVFRNLRVRRFGQDLFGSRPIHRATTRNGALKRPLTATFFVNRLPVLSVARVIGWVAISSYLRYKSDRPRSRDWCQTRHPVRA
jgi:hypothetical protein